MKYEMSQKDKKLLIMLLVFVIVVGIGYWGIYPMVRELSSAEKEIELQKELKDANELKILQLPMIEADNDEKEQSIIDARKTYYPMMKSNEIDRYFTDMILEYGLYSYDLTISMPQTTCTLGKYQYAVGQTAEEESTSTEDMTTIEKVESAAGSDASSSDDSSDSVFADDENMVDNGIYAADITMRLGGSRKTMQKFVDDLSHTDQKLKVCSYSYVSVQDVNQDIDGNFSVDNNDSMNLTVEIYMCEE